MSRNNDDEHGAVALSSDLTEDVLHMTREQLVEELRKLRWANAAAGDYLLRYEAVEQDNLRLRDGQMELAELGARYMDLYEGAPVPYLVIDEGGAIKELNREAAHWLGAETWELRGKTVSRFVVTKDRRAVSDHFQTCINRRRTCSVTAGFQIPGNDKPAIVKLVSRPLGNTSGAGVRGCRTLFIDVTQEKRGEEDLRVAVRMREDFLAVVAHDLRSPLAAIVMSAELLERHDDRHAHARGAERESKAPSHEIARIRRAAGRMDRLVGDLLDLSSMEAGRLAMEPTLENVENIIVAALEIASPQAARKSISLSGHVDSSALTAWCDRERVIQALLNLITNAVKFTATGSVSVRAKRCVDEVHFVVHDTGRGLSRTQIEHIFDPYWQASPHGRDGTGLGLSIVKGIVQLHGGRVWAESRPGRGSSFSFTLPRHGPGSADANAIARAALLGSSSEGLAISDGALEITAPLPRPSPLDLGVGGDPAQSCRPLVVLIDDEGAVRESVTDALDAEGYEVVAFPNGRAALDFLEHSDVAPAVILLDLVMPVMDGWEFLRQQSRTPRLSTVPVVLVSAQADRHRTESEAAGHHRLAGHIQKPVRLANLCEVVGNCTTGAA